jgi:hypothetical protein
MHKTIVAAAVVLLTGAGRASRNLRVLLAK